MKLDLAALRTRATQIWSEFTAGQRATLGIAVAAFLVLAYLMLSWASAPTWTPLYSGLAPEDAVEITTELDKMGVSHKLDNAGTTVLVPEGQLYRSRIELSAAGMPAGGVSGYEIMDEAGLTTSQFEQRVNFQRAIEGELARTISSIENIESATVHLVMPEDDLFAGDDVMATGSVLLAMRGDGAPTGNQVQAIINLVSSSVEGLTSDNVSVADTTGRVLSAPGQDGLNFAVTEARMSQQQAYEAAVARAIESLLVPVTGVGKARVVVSADLDFDERQSVSRSFGEADTAAVGAEQVTNETYTGTNPAVGGVLGPDVIPPEDGESNNEYAREDANRTYLVDETTQEVISAPGSVSRLSVAVLIDETVGVNTAEVADLVSASAGLQVDRGDTIQVSAMTFAALDDGIDADAPGTTASAGDDLVMVAARSAGVVILVLLILLLAYRSAKRSSLAKYPLALPVPDDEDEEGGMAGLDDETLAALGQLKEIDLTGEPKELPPPEPPEHLVLGNELGELIDRQPEDVAAVLRTWLADRRS